MDISFELITEISRQSDRPASPAVRLLIDEILVRHGQAARAILFYGSCLRTGDELNGLVDLYLLVDNYRAAYRRVIEAYRDFKAQGVPLKRLDLGGGLGITYRDETPPDLEAYAAMVEEETAGLEAELAFEPGRLLVGNAGMNESACRGIHGGRRNRRITVGYTAPTVIGC